MAQHRAEGAGVATRLTIVQTFAVYLNFQDKPLLNLKKQRFVFRLGSVFPFLAGTEPQTRELSNALDPWHTRALLKLQNAVNVENREQ